ncbi:MAG: methylenetetrahydrofolate reductase [Thermoguttaceae bacterium]
MAQEKTELERRIESGKPLVLAEMAPPCSADPAPVRAVAKRLAGKVHALGVSDNRDRVRMSALVAASLVAAEGVEPILHMVTRDRNRVAMIANCLGAAALGVRNILCTTGTHQTLGQFRSAKNVFDLDCVQMLRLVAGLDVDASLVGEERIENAGPFCLGGVAAPFADPLELQVLRLSKKAAAGARFLITQPIYDLQRFETWWNEMKRLGIHQKVAVVAGIEPLHSAEDAKRANEKRPSARIPTAVIDRLAAKPGQDAQRAIGIDIAAETIDQLRRFPELRGFEIGVDGDVDAAVEVISKAGLTV